MWVVHYSLIDPDVSVSIPNLGEGCFYEALNPQFQYETQASLEKALQQEYGNVVGYKHSLIDMLLLLLTSGEDLCFACNRSSGEDD